MKIRACSVPRPSYGTSVRRLRAALARITAERGAISAGHGRTARLISDAMPAQHRDSASLQSS